MGAITSRDMVICSGRRGRPIRAESHSIPRTVRMSSAEWQRANKAAEVNCQNFTQFAQDAILTAMEECLEDEE